MAKIPCVGGPADGTRVNPKDYAFIWVDSTGTRLRLAEPGAGLYQNVGDRLRYCGEGSGVCEGCGSFVTHVEGRAVPARCPLCGGKVATAARGEPLKEG